MNNDATAIKLDEESPIFQCIGNDLNMESFYLAIINNLHDGIYFVDAHRKICFWNKAAEQITGYSAKEIVGKHCQDGTLNHIDDEGRPLCTVGCPLFIAMDDGVQHHGHVFLQHKDGYRIPVHVNIFPVELRGKIIGAIEMFAQESPVTYDGDLVEKLSNMAMYDALTQLANRRYLQSFLKYKLEEYKRFGNLFAVLFADIDDFREFNNNYGHVVGDNVLKNIAKTVKFNMRRGDLIGRWGGEEFVGIYSLVKEEDVPLIAEKFHSLVSNTMITAQKEQLYVSVSVGITLVQKSDTSTSIINRADSLMYEAKKAGKNQVVVG